MAGSSIPLGVVDLTDGCVSVMNEAALALFDRPASEIIGQPATSLWDDSYTDQAEKAMAALSSGAIDSYRALRRIPRPTGPIDVWLWTRTVTLTHGDVAVGVAVPVGDSDASGRLIGTYFGPDAIEVAVGTVDRHSRRLAEIRPRSQVVLDLAPEEVPGADLISLVHPDDMDRLIDVLGKAGDPSDDAVTVRLRQGDGAWAEIQCIALPTSPDEPLRVAFTPAAPPPADAPGDRLADLERQILRIAAELHSVSDLRRDSPVAESQRPALDALHPKQRDIVDRLVRGERVPTIAKAMYLSPSTVRNHLSKVFKIFGVDSQASLLAALRADVQTETGTAPGGRRRTDLTGPLRRAGGPLDTSTQTLPRSPRSGRLA